LFAGQPVESGETRRTSRPGLSAGDPLCLFPQRFHLFGELAELARVVCGADAALKFGLLVAQLFDLLKRGRFGVPFAA
jgi:hypothetical protein